MKLVVLKPFIDVETGMPYNEGYTYETDDADRATTLKDAGYVDGDIKKRKGAKGGTDNTNGADDTSPEPTDEGKKS